MDTKQALQIAIEHYKWDEDVAHEISSAIHQDLTIITNSANFCLRDEINGIDPTILTKYDFHPSWKIVPPSSEPAIDSYSLEIPSYEHTLAHLTIRTGGCMSIVIYNDRGYEVGKVDCNDYNLSLDAIETATATWVRELQEVAYYKQNNQVCRDWIERILTSRGYPIKWEEGLKFDFYEWIDPRIGSIYTPKIGTPISHPFTSIEVIDFDKQAYYLPTTVICRKHSVSSIAELKNVSPSLVHQFKQSIDGFIQIDLNLMYPEIDKAIFKVDDTFGFEYEFYCPIPEIAAVVCQQY